MTHRHGIDVARSYLGIKEATGNNDGAPAKLFLKGDAGLAWCAAFVWVCFDESDDPAPPGNYWRMRSVAYFEKACKKAGFWFGPRIQPQTNDIIFFGNRGLSDAGRGRHMGIVEDANSQAVKTIEGNLSNQVKRAMHPLHSRRITGYARLVTL